jgi:diacylglycerol kinase (ATP)
MDKTVALVNPKSGERASAAFLVEELNRILPNRVVDLSQCFADQTAAIDLIRQHALGGFVLVAGGDGTVSFGMDIVDKLDWDSLGQAQRPHITVIPMGTGNDLSRAIGHGPGFSKDKCPCACSSCCRVETMDETITAAISAPKAVMDRFSISVTARNGSGVLEQRVMNNYFSIGFDAHIAKTFDTFRKEHPGLCKTRLLNKAWYGCLGCGALCGEPCLDKTVTLEVDGVVTELPDGIKSLVVSNVDSFAGGVVLWKDSKKKYQPPSVRDGLVEVQGIYGSFHMGMMQGKLRSAVKIAQGKKVKIVTSQVHWMQWDGEAMDNVKEEAVIEIEHHSSPRILDGFLSTNPAS